MKTVMQELIEVVKKRRNFIEDDGYKEAMEDVLLIALNLIEAEKEQIWMAFNDGKISAIVKNQRTPEEYYNLTYKADE